MKLVNEDAFLIVWTTMPFTLVTDAMVGLNPEEDSDLAVNAFTVLNAVEKKLPNGEKNIRKY